MSSFILRILTLHLLISPTFCIIYFLVSCLHCSLLLCINFSSLLSLLFLSRTTSILNFPSYYFPSCLVSSRLGASLTSSCLLFCLCLLSPSLPLLVFFSPHLIFFTCVFSPVLSCKSFCTKTRWDETRQKVVEGKICCSVGQVDLPCVCKPCTHRYNAGVSSPQISDCITLVNNLWFSLSLSLSVAAIVGDGQYWAGLVSWCMLRPDSDLTLLILTEALRWGKNQYFETTERELLTWPEGEMKNERQSDESDWVQERNAALKTQSREEKATALMDESHIVPAGDVVLKLHEYLDTLADEHKSNMPNSRTHRLI